MAITVATTDPITMVAITGRTMVDTMVDIAMAVTTVAIHTGDIIITMAAGVTDTMEVGAVMGITVAGATDIMEVGAAMDTTVDITITTNT